MTKTSNDLDLLHHVAIPVEDVARALKWYQEKFQCRVLYQDETWGFLEFGNIKLALVIESQHPAHIAFLREDAASYGPLTRHRDGTASVYIQDSEGNSVEILSES